MEEKTGAEEVTLSKLVGDGKDELNLAEFPLCALAHRLRGDQKTLRFEDRVWDERRGETITRQLTITGADAYGLPTALDEEVLLGLIQISRLSYFAERTVRFTRYQLIRLLGWRLESKSYERIEASLNRWTGVMLYYQRAWWNKAKQCWMDEEFHVLDNVRLYHREPGMANDEAGLSSFTWNDVIFHSFQAGNLKSIDFDFFRELRSSVARRLYRFLDKRFYRRTRWEFDLREFACEHAGLARDYDTGNLKRKLRSGILELEERGYLRPMTEGERFPKLRVGQWRVVFEQAQRQSQTASPVVENSASPLVEALVQRGVAPFTAGRVSQQFEAEKIQGQLNVFDYLIAKGDDKVSRNPPGFLLSAIRGDYAPPKGYLDHAAQEQRRHQAEKRRAREQKRLEQEEQARLAREEAREKAIADFWRSLSEVECKRLEAEAIRQATATQVHLIQQGGKLGEAARRVVLDSYALSCISVPG